MRLFISLRRDEFDRLLRLAEAERRRPQDQAAMLIACELDRREQYQLDGSGDKSLELAGAAAQ